MHTFGVINHVNQRLGIAQKLFIAIYKAVNCWLGPLLLLLLPLSYYYLFTFYLFLISCCVHGLKIKSIAPQKYEYYAKFKILFAIYDHSINGILLYEI